MRRLLLLSATVLLLMSNTCHAQHWAVVHHFNLEDLHSPPHLFFVNGTYGFAYGPGGGSHAGMDTIRLFRTTDGGQNWTDLSNGLTIDGYGAYGELYDCWFTSAQHGYLCGLTYSDDLGPVATTLAYVNTSNANGIVRANRVIPDYYLPPGGLINGTWPAAGGTASTGTPDFVNPSIFPMVMHPAVGSTPLPNTAQHIAAPVGTWAVNAAYQPVTLNPYTFSMIDVDYVSPGYTNTIRVSGHVDNIAGQWPISLPDDWGLSGDASIPVGVGYKQGNGAMAVGGGLSVSLSSNPVMNGTTVKLTGPTSHAVNLRVLDLLGKTMQTSDPVTLTSEGASVPLHVSSWPSGNYVIEATGDEGSHARMMFSVQN